MQSLISFLTSTGLGSRRHCFDLLVNGYVRVNGMVAAKASLSVNSGVDEVTVRGQTIALPKRKLYLKLNKPLGVISTISDELGRRTVVDLIPVQYRNFRLYPVGRLDSGTSGLMIMTNDGDLANFLTHPKFEVEKEYQVLLDRELNEDEISELQMGVEINGHRTSPCKIVRLRKRTEPWYAVIIHEGKKRELRFMFLAAGAKVRQICRVRIGRLKLGNLQVGRSEELTSQELDLLHPN
ncbi:rRNA pseudouridine synthase [SAR202 cluster bacterium AD-804-J14_MRT_500m]|nr:rRNA pseudouridine synthase [SAR202 cluster bacterium AD-804-J14_MRT_500m]